jgi:transketolase N-terminal domain/subunit
MKRHTVRQGRRYRALISLGVIERIASNAMIAQRFAELGFTEISVMGSGAQRVVEALWPLPDAEGKSPRQVSEITEI